MPCPEGTIFVKSGNAEEGRAWEMGKMRERAGRKRETGRSRERIECEVQRGTEREAERSRDADKERRGETRR